MQDTLHDRLVDLACRNGGWRTGPWKPSFKAKCRENGMWAGELENEDGGNLIWSDVRRNPDAWRLVVEGPDTPGKGWSYPILIIEFLEVEISHPIPLDKRRDYVRLWWYFDGTTCFHMRVYRMERYGDTSLWLDTNTAHQEITL